jgi:hypothetical protein
MGERKKEKTLLPPLVPPFLRNGGRRKRKGESRREGKGIDDA